MDIDFLFLVVLALTILNFGVLFFLIFLLRKKHRFLFQLIVNNNEKLSDLINKFAELRLSFSSLVRKEIRCFDFRKSNINLTNRIPFNFQSQFGEDTFVYDFFYGKRDGFFVEAGALDGVTFSNTYFLESIGWNGVLVEANPDYINECRKKRPNSKVIHTALGSEAAHGNIELNMAGILSFLKADQQHIERCIKDGYPLQKIYVPYSSLNSLLKNVTTKVDFLSLDVEGMELEVLRGFDIEKYSPELILIESNDVKEEEKISSYLKGFDYLPSVKIGPNRFYVQKNYLDKFQS